MRRQQPVSTNQDTTLIMQTNELERQKPRQIDIITHSASQNLNRALPGIFCHFSDC